MGEPVLKNKPGLSGVSSPASSDPSLGREQAPVGLKIYHSQSEDLDQYEGASFKPRFFAALVDGIFFSMIQKVIGGFLLKGLLVYVTARSAGLGAALYLGETALLVFYYYAWPLSEWGQTLGKKFFNLRVVNTKSHHDIGIMQAFARETFGKALSVLPLGFGFIMVLFDKKRLALHDKLLKTKVIKYR